MENLLSLLISRCYSLEQESWEREKSCWFIIVVGFGSCFFGFCCCWVFVFVFVSLGRGNNLKLAEIRAMIHLKAQRQGDWRVKKLSVYSWMTGT